MVSSSLLTAVWRTMSLQLPLYVIPAHAVTLTLISLPYSLSLCLSHTQDLTQIALTYTPHGREFTPHSFPLHRKSIHVESDYRYWLTYNNKQPH
jgi:hypothetical protein